jgi:hypothetical protein
MGLRLTLPPSMRIRNTFSSCLRTSSAPIKISQVMPNLAHTVAVATPC